MRLLRLAVCVCLAAICLFYLLAHPRKF
jgi:hypothetical protein